MSHVRRLLTLSVFALLITLGLSNASAEELKTVFVISMENHNWTQPANQFTGPIQQIFHNPNAPFINSLVDGTAVTTINGHDVRISEQVSFASATTMYWRLQAATIRIFIHPNRTISGRKRAPTLAWPMITIPLPPTAQPTRTPRNIW